jgi:raffinose/stachyose/melibiose transport system permease protein
MKKNILFSNKMKTEIQYELFLIPAIVGYILFFIWPLLSNFYYSFTNWNGLNPSYKFIGFKNYVGIFQDREMVIAIKNTLLYAGLMTLVQNVLAIPLAVALDAKLKTKNFLRLLFFVPAVMSPLVVGFLWSYIMAPGSGLLWILFEQIGLTPINWLGNPKIVMYSITMVSVWQWTGWAAVIYLANLQGISQDYYEAARVDGANVWKQFWNITFPMLAPALTINVMNSMIGSLKVFDIIMSMTQGGPGSSSETITTVLIKRAFTESRLGYGSAIAVVFLGITAFLSMILLKYLQAREERLV